MVFVIAPHTPQTEGLIGAAELALLPDGALLVNVARGKLVDTDALVAATADGRIRAALDVTEPEPLPPDHPLWRMPGVLISPHVGGASSAFFPRADRLIAAQLRRFAAAENWRTSSDEEGDKQEAAGPEPPCIFCGIVAGSSRRGRSTTTSTRSPSSTSPPGTAATPWSSQAARRRPVSGEPSLAEIAPAVDAVARMLMHRLAADGINLLSSAGEVAGQTVFHLHVHVVPRYADEPGLDRLVNPVVVPDGELESVYRQIQAGA